ncbi:MAG: FliH/SctL family protein [Clostridium sp.]|nr:FliH/SctL family protein [Clostridium sp.]
MHLSCNFIKGNRVLEQTNTKVISTNYQINTENNKALNDNITYEKVEYLLNNYEKIGQGIIEDARRQKEKILLEAVEQTKEIEKEAYETGYSQGIKNGEEDGKKEALETYLPQAKAEAEEIRQKATNIILRANEYYADYLESKKKEIIDLAFTIAEQVLHKELKKENSLNELVEEAIKLSKGEENIVIKCNPLYEEELKKNAELWQATNNISGKIFIMVDDDIEEGNAIVEKNTGKIVVGIDVGLKRIQDAILG